MNSFLKKDQRKELESCKFHLEQALQDECRRHAHDKMNQPVHLISALARLNYVLRKDY